jgi:hypothetical protein
VRRRSAVAEGASAASEKRSQSKLARATTASRAERAPGIEGGREPAADAQTLIILRGEGPRCRKKAE